MQVKINRSDVDGDVTAPGSKSMTHRALVCSALAPGKSILRSPLTSDDTKATIRILKMMGIEIDDVSDPWVVHGGTLSPTKAELFCSESGTTLRFMVALSSQIDAVSIFTGGPSLSKRPVNPLLKALNQIGIKTESNEGHLPVKVMGKSKIEGGEVSIRGDISSQFISALLLIAPLTDEMKINLTTSIESKPYIRMTIDAQRIFGVSVHASEDMRKYLVKKQTYLPTDMIVEGDWSSASNLLAAGALAGKVTINNLNKNSHQADAIIIDILEKMGARIKSSDNRVIVEKSPLNAIDVDLSDSPDLFPITASLCTSSSGVSTLRCLGRLRYKESDRLVAMAEGLKQMGASLRKEGDSMVIKGGKTYGKTINPHNDHRIAMAFSVLGLISEGATTIMEADCVNKSYPNFWEDLMSIGAKLRRE